MPKPKLIESPEQLWSYFEEYQKYCKENPFKVHDFVGKDGMEVFRLKERPLTIEGFKVYCNKNYSTIQHYINNTDGQYDQYRTICGAIKEAIRHDQVEGGMVGIYNASITQRLNNLVEKSEQTIDAKVTTANFGSTIIPTTSKPSEGTS